ncbi:MAG: methyltransferase [Acidobacteria bacterium]|nr:MAG: methyltransferase [Acidobacteriota bacterium]
MKKLDDSQVVAFDTEYVDDTRWLTVRMGIDRDFPVGEFTFLDVGGGNGRFADRVLAEYPGSKGTVLDNSEVLVSRNQPNERKAVLLDSVENLDQINMRYDIIFVNWLLHHLVGVSYAVTRRNQLWALRTLGALLTERGRISVFENVYDGALIENLPGWLIYQLSANQAISGITRRLGANTAGIGVCFLSKKQWLSAMNDAGLEVLRDTEPDSWNWSMPLSWKVCLHIQRRYVSHFWLRPRESGSGQ